MAFSVRKIVVVLILLPVVLDRAFYVAQPTFNVKPPDVNSLLATQAICPWLLPGFLQNSASAGAARIARLAGSFRGPKKMESPRLAISLIGVGQMGRRILPTLDAMSAEQNLQIHAVARRASDDLRQAYAGHPAVTVTQDDAARLLADRNVQAVILATPAETHHALAKQALEAGKHVLVEKPFVLHVAEGEELVALARQKNLVLMVGHTLLYSPVFDRLKELVHSGALGEIRSIEAHFLNPKRPVLDRTSTVIEDLGTHELYMISALLDQERPSDIRSIEVSPSGEAVGLTLAYHGVPVQIQLSREFTGPQSRQLKVVGRSFTVVYDHSADPHVLTVVPTGITYDPKRLQAIRERLATGQDDPTPLTQELKVFLQAIQNGPPPVSSGGTALPVVSIIYDLPQRFASSVAAAGTAIASGAFFLTNSAAPTVGIVGGGFFGATSAWVLARAGFRVTLYERGPDLMRHASETNSGRIHLGFHYPRSAETVREVQEAFHPFVEEYGESLIANALSLYAIAKEESRISSDAYRRFIETSHLFADEVSFDGVLNSQHIAYAVRSMEGQIDQSRLRDIVWSRLKFYGVDVRLNTPRTAAQVQRAHDYAVYATYADTNRFLPDHQQRSFQFELMELVLMEMPQAYRDLSAVVMDGPFAAIGPWNGTPYHLLTHVVHSIHYSNTGFFPDIPAEWNAVLGKGMFANPPIASKKDLIIQAALDFFPGLAEARYVGSVFALKTVPAHRDADDARPTTVSQVGPREYSIESGKLNASLKAAQSLLHLIRHDRLLSPRFFSPPTPTDWNTTISALTEWHALTSELQSMARCIRMPIRSYQAFLMKQGPPSRGSMAVEQLVGLKSDRQSLFIQLVQLLRDPIWMFNLTHTGEIPSVMDYDAARALAAFRQVPHARNLFLDIAQDAMLLNNLRFPDSYAHLDFLGYPNFLTLIGENEELLGMLCFLRPDLATRTVMVTLYEAADLIVHFDRMIEPFHFLLDRAGWKIAYDNLKNKSATTLTAA